MDCQDMEDSGMKTRSFRFEGSNNRRVFLRSYPLQWGEEEKTDEDMVQISEEKKEKKPIKKIILSVFQWSEGKVLILRRFKNKLTVFVIACVPVRFKRPAALISA